MNLKHYNRIMQYLDDPEWQLLAFSIAGNYMSLRKNDERVEVTFVEFVKAYKKEEWDLPLVCAKEMIIDILETRGV